MLKKGNKYIKMTKKQEVIWQVKYRLLVFRYNELQVEKEHRTEYIEGRLFENAFALRTLGYADINNKLKLKEYIDELKKENPLSS